MADIKIFSWNVNGLRAVIRKGEFQKFLKANEPDVVCLQEIKCKPEQLDLFEMNELKDYEVVFRPAERAGYSGVATMIRKGIEFKEITDSVLSETEFSKLARVEGRVVVVEFSKFVLVNVYTPNSKPDLSRLELREEMWDPEFREMLKKIETETKKPVVTCGDFNAAHEEIDIARPVQNHHNAGFTDEEREGVTKLVGDGFVDSFRKMHPGEQRFSWWSHWGKARENNVGWRIDYFFVSEKSMKNVKTAEIFEKQLGSDHCPVMIRIEE